MTIYTRQHVEVMENCKITKMLNCTGGLGGPDVTGPVTEPTKETIDSYCKHGSLYTGKFVVFKHVFCFLQ